MVLATYCLDDSGNTLMNIGALWTEKKVNEYHAAIVLTVHKRGHRIVSVQALNSTSPPRPTSLLNPPVGRRCWHACPASQLGSLSASWASESPLCHLLRHSFTPTTQIIFFPRTLDPHHIKFDPTVLVCQHLAFREPVGYHHLQLYIKECDPITKFL